MSYSDSAERLYSRIKRAGFAVFVFIHGGKVRSLKSNDHQMQKFIDSDSTHFIGVYNGNCEFAWLLDDLRWAEARYAYQ